MNAESGEHLARSVHQRLLNLARQEGDDFNALLVQFAMERALYRLSCSNHRSSFVLKGALLFRVWDGDLHRPTMDIDLLGHGDAAVERVADVFREVLSWTDVADGLSFDIDRLAASEIRGAQEYGGVRVKCDARLGSAAIRTQIDIGFGDAITPGTMRGELPGILDFPTAHLDVYPPETVIAEKLEAIVRLGEANSRMKDFHDLRLLSKRASLSADSIAAAIRATFDRRRTEIPQQTPVGLTASFAQDAAKATQWRAFDRRVGGSGESLWDVVQDVAEFVAPLIARARQKR